MLAERLNHGNLKRLDRTAEGFGCFYGPALATDANEVVVANPEYIGSLHDPIGSPPRVERSGDPGRCASTSSPSSCALTIAISARNGKLAGTRMPQEIAELDHKIKAQVQALEKGSSPSWSPSAQVS